jgi:hypothetical protein
MHPAPTFLKLLPSRTPLWCVVEQGFLLRDNWSERFAAKASSSPGIGSVLTRATLNLFGTSSRPFV